MNKIKCLGCNTELESKFRWDFESCNCENQTFVDGGNDYKRFGGKDINKVLFWNEKKQQFTKIKK